MSYNKSSNKSKRSSGPNRKDKEDFGKDRPESNRNGKRNKYAKDKNKVDKKYPEKDVPTAAIGDNSPEWYIPDPKVMDQATRFSFSQFVGVPFDLDPLSAISGMNGDTIYPGSAMQIMLNPCPGYVINSNPKVAAVNQQAFRTYARLSSVNAKNTNYLPSDISTMILAMGELIKLFSLAQRAYGLLWTFNVRNRDLPFQIIDLAGVDSAKLRANAASYLTRLNTLIVEANKIPFPSNIDYFKLCAQIYSGVYTDGDSNMAELYVCLPFSTWDLEEAIDPEGTKLVTHPLWEHYGTAFEPMDPDDLLTLIENKVNDMLTSATYNYVYSDIMNLATKDSSVGLLAFMPVDFSYTVLPTHDKEFLLKLNNATALGEPLPTAKQHNPDNHTNDNDVIPDVESMCILYSPQWENETPIFALDKILNFYVDEPTMEERIEACRWLNPANVVQVGPLKGEEGGKSTIPNHYYTGNRVALGDHYIVNVTVWTEANPGYSSNTLVDTMDPSENAYQLTRFSQHPYVYTIWDTGHGWRCDNFIGDVAFFTTVNYDLLERINKLALYGLFDVRDVTKS